MTPSLLPGYLPPGRTVPGFLAEMIPSLSSLGTSLSSARVCPTPWELSASQVPAWGVGSTATSVTGRHVCIASECPHPSRPEIGHIRHTRREAGGTVSGPSVWCRDGRVSGRARS